MKPSSRKGKVLANSKIFKKLKPEIERTYKRLKGDTPNPIFCLGISSFVLLILICSISGMVIKPLSETKGFSFSENSVEGSNELFMVSQEENKPDSPELLLVGKNSLAAVTPPAKFTPQILGAIVGGKEMQEQRKGITEYIVEAGDNLSSVAAKFGISLNTVLWANDLNSRSSIRPGQKMIIPPVTGVIHHVKQGETISSIAENYKGKTDEVISINSLSGGGDVYVGDIIVVPNGEMPAKSYAAVTSNYIPLANSYFICPISSPCRITQGLHYYNAIDFSHGKCGDAIYAAAGGEVVKVQFTESTSKWAYGGAGNNISILHPNGVVTAYGHLAKSFVSVGQQVSQGQLIALMGGQPGTPGAGLTTGCHLHFSVKGARNPFAY